MIKNIGSMINGEMELFQIEHRKLEIAMSFFLAVLSAKVNLEQVAN